MMRPVYTRSPDLLPEFGGVRVERCRHLYHRKSAATLPDSGSNSGERLINACTWHAAMMRPVSTRSPDFLPEPGNVAAVTQWSTGRATPSLVP
eukprot:5917661-Prymnesium_polylepis.1